MLGSDIFRPSIDLIYPPNNNKTFEEFFFQNYDGEKTKTDRKYLPIFWTSYYIKNNFGKDDGKLQNYIDSLDRDTKYFTIVQYDDNILEELGDLDIMIFSQGGFGKNKEKCYPIPLNCQINTDRSTIRCTEQRDIFASFIGKIDGRHPIREKIRDTLKTDKYLISESTTYQNFLDVLSRSKFSLCPRGYGQTSFRIHESLSLGAIPVYIYDEPHIPFSGHFNFNDIGICIHEQEIPKINDVLESIQDNKINEMRKTGSDIFNEFFEYGGCFRKIIDTLNNEK